MRAFVQPKAHRLAAHPLITAPRALGAIQTKLGVGSVDDPLEHQADCIADQVMRMPEAAPSLTAAPLLALLAWKAARGGVCRNQPGIVG